MTLWARLTWQAADPAALVRALGRALGVEAAADERGTGAFVVALGLADLEVVPWRREVPADDPQAGGRLVFEPAPGGVPERPPERLPGLVLAGVGWATVELDRAEARAGRVARGRAGGPGR